MAGGTRDPNTSFVKSMMKSSSRQSKLNNTVSSLSSFNQMPMAEKKTINCIPVTTGMNDE